MKKELFRIYNLTLSQQQLPLLTNLYLQIFENEHAGILFNSFKERDIFADFLSGTLCPSEGRIYYREHSVSFSDYVKIARTDFTLVTENSRLMDNLTVYENLFYEQFPNIWISAHKQRAAAQALLSRFKLNINVTQTVSSLSQYDRIALELIKAFSQKKSIVFISNISSLLDSTEYSLLMTLLTQLEECGITFLIGETFDTQLFRLTNTLHIIKNGQITRILTGSLICQKEIQKSLGSYSVINSQQIFHSQNVSSNTALQFQEVTDVFLKNLSFTLKKGKIIKILCANSRQSELLYSFLCKQQYPAAGEIFFYGTPLSSIDVHTYNKKCGMILPNPRQTMILYNMSVLDNLCFSIDRKTRGILTNCRYRRGIECALQGEIPARYFSEKISAVPAEIIQKVIYCRWLLAVPDLLVCINPFSITDPSLNYITKDLLQKMTMKGIPVLIISNNWSMDMEIEGEAIFL